MGSIGSKRKALSQEGEEVNFDHFQVLRAIGKGSFGKVCIVQKLSSENLYAMKYMNKAQCEAKDAVANVFREIEILASVEHPFLVNLWFTFQDEEDMFMVVDLLLGGDLRYHVQQGIPFSNEAVRLFILEAGSALDYLHRKKIIHRDIKPDNLLLDEEGHVHLTDFNIATVLKAGHLATSMSGTKPYMAPEVFECAADYCDGYNHAVDWWSLGVSAYEIRRGQRPFDIHSHTTISDVRIMFLSPPKFPSDWTLGFVQLLSKLLTVSPASRVTSLEALMRIPFAADVNIDDVLKKQIKPPFTPATDHLNCDPTFELEEMIIESKPLHKKKKRLLKQKSVRDSQHTISLTQNSSSVGYDSMIIFNRERELARKAREKKEKEWQEELDRSMNLSDPTGQGSGFCGSKLSFRRKRSNRDAEALEGVLNTLIAASAKSFAASIGPIQGYEEYDQLSKSAKDHSLKLPCSKSDLSLSNTAQPAKQPYRLKKEICQRDMLEDSSNAGIENKSEVSIKITDGENNNKEKFEKSSAGNIISDLQNLNIQEPSNNVLCRDNYEESNDTEITDIKYDRLIEEKITNEHCPATKERNSSQSNSRINSSSEVIPEEIERHPREKDRSDLGTAYSVVASSTKLSLRPASDPLPPTNTSENITLNVGLHSRSQLPRTNKGLPRATKSSKVRNIAPVSKRSQSFNSNPGERHERFLPQRNSCDTCILKTVNAVLNDSEDPDSATTENTLETLEKKQVECVSVNLCALTPRYTSSLEILSSSSSGNLQKISSRSRVVLEDSKRSASEETQLYGESLLDSESRLLELTNSENLLMQSKTDVKKTFHSSEKCSVDKRVNKNSNKQDFRKTFSSHSLQMAPNNDPRKSYNRSTSTDSPNIRKFHLREIDDSVKSNIKKRAFEKGSNNGVSGSQKFQGSDTVNEKSGVDTQEVRRSTDDLMACEDLQNIT